MFFDLVWPAKALLSYCEFSIKHLSLEQKDNHTLFIFFFQFHASIKLVTGGGCLLIGLLIQTRGVKKAEGRLERDSGMLFSRLVMSPIRPLLGLVVIEIVAKLTKIEQLKKSEQVRNTATEKNLVCICVRLWGGF